MLDGEIRSHEPGASAAEQETRPDFQKMLDNTEIQVSSPEQKKLEALLDNAAEIQDMYETTKGGDQTALETFLDEADSQLKIWEGAYDNLPDDLKNSTDGRDLALKIEDLKIKIKDANMAHDQSQSIAQL